MYVCVSECVASAESKKKKKAKKKKGEAAINVTEAKSNGRLGSDTAD